MTTDEKSTHLKSLIEKIESLESEKTELLSLIRDAFAEAKFAGYDPKIMKQVIKCRKMGKDAYLEQEQLLGTYLAALDPS
ncbi:DUF2312 domain-containing protein [Candidatus Hepatobacter penaei]|uniref:DUF2312 domain-containing protein n=1 Tax=Candidatus Hepatobacter penaei TaxID=1274402 RepID=UPI0004F2914B|nr:DUF2312 domain-containing protein [Candidatus Hepatobacter penaei]TGW15339.1 DUF2312 domain-containing protein [bacterium NHP-B]